MLGAPKTSDRLRQCDAHRSVVSCSWGLRGNTWESSVAFRDLERLAPQIFRSGPMATDPTAPIRAISVGQGGRLTAWRHSQPEDLLQRDEVDP